MRTIIFTAAILLTACGQNSSEKKKDSDTTRTVTDTTIPPVVPGHAGIVPGAAKVNAKLTEAFGGKWHVITDKESGWMPDVFDYFVVPERKKDPDFPYIAHGDYDCDGKTDVAALVTDSLHKENKIVYILNEGKTFSWWKEDVLGAAIKNLPKSEVVGFEDAQKEKKVQMKCDGVEVAWFETSSYVIYRKGSGFDNVWTGD